MNFSYGSVCKGKQRHATVGVARAAIRSLDRRGVSTADMRPYVCQFCKGWHVGHYPKRVSC